ncbi:flippase [Chondromyces crocatus]|uniref:Polysaccharide biosynthesis protein n=1 Tax=Chondromyces crocatus TaxID=52 RepID=A0A0K1EJD2_CHOCO|nr:flippase [Chondromyces crocatus]AKT40970.1 polysaccharide biosynthesis protein [Chondromyces crocatus]
MRVGQRIALNTALMVGKQVFTAVLGVAFVGYLARQLGVAEWGELQASIALTSTVAVVAGIGVRGYLAREVAVRPETGAQHVGSALAIRGGMGAVLLAVTAVVALVAKPGLGATLIAIAAASQLATLLYNTVWLAFEAHERLQYIAYAELSARVIVIALAMGLLALGGGVIAAALALAVGNVLEFLVSYYFLRARFYRPVLRVGFPELLRVARLAIPIGLVGALLMALQQADRVLLRWLADEEAVGVYSAAWVLSEQFRLLPDVFLGAAFAAAVRLYVGDSKAFGGLYQNCMSAALLLGMPIAAGATLLAPDIILLVYGSRAGYGPAAGVLPLLMLQVPLAFAFQVASLPLLAARREVVLVKLLLAALVVNVLVDVALIPRYGARGAALGAMSATTISLVGCVWQTWRWVRLVVVRRVAAMAVATALMTAVAYGGRMIGGMWLAIAVGALSYAGLALALRAVSWEELRTLLRRQPPVSASPPSAPGSGSGSDAPQSVPGGGREVTGDAARGGPVSSARRSRPSAETGAEVLKAQGAPSTSTAPSI